MERVRMLKITMLGMVLVLAGAGPVAARTFYVDPNGSADFTTIQAALLDPSTGDGNDIEVAPGTYNEAINFLGKAVRLYSSGGPDVTTINANGAYHVVQCVSGEDANTILEGFTITGGNANGTDYNSYGGGMLNLNSSPTVTGCTFTDNVASENGGGMFNVENSNPTVSGCTFSGNDASWNGGGMSNENSSNPTVTGCTFSGNSASGDVGGGMLNFHSSPTVRNCNFIGNTAGKWGGGMYNDVSSPTVTNCTFSGNSANGDGGGMANMFDSSPTVTNCIFWNDAPDEIYNNNSTAIFTYSDIQGGWLGTGNIDADPMFADADGRLLPGSPCIDAGDNAAVPSSVTTDLDGKPRIVNGTVDMGAFEAQLDPSGLLLKLMQTVMNLNLQKGILNSLDAKLSAAMQAIDDINQNNDVAAINTLGAFINAVEAQRGNMIPEADAVNLITAAQQIINILSSE